MSLQVWLPLDGDLRNQGLNGSVIITNNGAVINDNGKIGKCYSFNGNSEIITSSVNTSSWINYSICCWIKADSTISDGTWHRIGGVAEHTFFQLDMSSKDVARFFISQDGTTSGIAVYATNSIVDGSWHHLCGIADNTKIALYIDGELIGTTARTIIYHPESAIIRIGNTYSGSKFKGLINDFRIYDHALSTKEVKELAKGLILHYRLSKPLPNLLKDIPKAYNATNYNAYQLNFTENLVANQTYTLQLWDVNVSHSAKTAAQLGISFYWGGGSVRLIEWIGTDYFIDGHADYLVGTFTPTEANAQHSQAANAWFNVYNSPGNATGTRNMSIGKWKLEKGNKATGYIPDNSSSLYSAMGYDSNIELNCAPTGNQNDGTIVGTIAATADSPRYETSYYFDGASYINIINPFDANTLIKDFSISCWIKKGYSDNTSTRYIYNGIIQLYIYTDGKIRITWNHAADDLSYNSRNTWACGILIPNDEWIHIVYTFSNGVIKVYKDGEYVSTSNRSNTGNNIRGYMGTTFNMSNSSQAFIGNVSDFHIYCTALSAEDIKELYNTAAQIDKNGNIYAYEFKEG